MGVGAEIYMEVEAERWERNGAHDQKGTGDEVGAGGTA